MTSPLSSNQAIFDLPPAEKRSLAAEVAARVFQAIMTGQIVQGQHINEADIAQSLQVSRAPVREALMQLREQGIITHIANRGAFVMQFTPSDIAEIWSLRSVLEQFAVTRLIDEANAETFAQLRDLLGEMRAVTPSDEGDQRLAELDLGFHEALIVASAHSRLFKVWVTLRNQTELLLYSSIHQQHSADIITGHAEILSALEQRDASAAQRVLAQHLSASYTFLTRLYATSPESTP